MSSSLPYWHSVILDRVVYHTERLLAAQDMGDAGAADAHAVVLEELVFLREALGIEVLADN